ncbi:helix-turn-helix domain-containing protein [Nonomuraea jabiensis]|uniref:helix-turn-helix domain-containing protein n=1 Tax=Nonomuraea jabiensis TaxID=882448 RepID=UPI003D763EDB
MAMGQSYGFVHRLLEEEGATLRPRRGIQRAPPAAVRVPRSLREVGRWRARGWPDARSS